MNNIIEHPDITRALETGYGLAVNEKLEALFERLSELEQEKEELEEKLLEVNDNIYDTKEDLREMGYLV